MMRIGIFWYDKNQVIGIAHDFDLSDVDSLGLIDSSYTHIEYWEILRCQFEHLKYLEYEEIPRGRVIFNIKMNQTIVYMDAKLFKKLIAQKVVSFFDLDFEQVKWKKDPHYCTIKQQIQTDKKYIPYFLPITINIKISMKLTTKPVFKNPSRVVQPDPKIEMTYQMLMQHDTFQPDLYNDKYGMAQFSWQQLRQFVYNNLHDDDYKSKVSTCVNYLLISLIIANVAAVLLESVDDLYKLYQPYFNIFENLSILIFSGEYLLRLWSIIEKNPQESAWKQRFRWMKSGGAIIDLMAILPAYLNFFVHIDLRFLRVLRLFRLLKLTRYFVSLQILLRVIQREKGSFQAVIFILVIMIVMTASAIYVVENKAQPEAFSSIPKAMWWAVVTLTTVGYGDVTPVTNLGRILGAFITILGVGIAALPAGILASGLANELNQRNQSLEQEFRETLQAKGLDLLHDQVEIERIRKKVGLPKEQTHEIIIQLVREKLLESQEQEKKKYHYCPHCGEKLSE